MNFSSMISGERNIPLHQRRRLSLNLNGVSNSKDSSEDNLDLFSDESDVSEKLGRLSIESAKQGESGLDDLLSSTDGGKHDYDWLLTPPGTPLVPPLDVNESRSALVAPRSSPSIRSTSTIKASRLSASQSESSRPARPTRSSSATRPSVSSFQYSINSNKSNSILNTSSASVSSYIRSSTPTSRSSSVTRSSTPSARSKVSRSSTPCKVHPAPNVPSNEKPRPSQNSRPSTPTSRPHVSANMNSIGSRSTSRPSTPTRRSPAPSISPVTGPSVSGVRTLARQNLASVSRPSSPGSRVRSQPQPVVPPDFPLETPPNLRTTLPDRPPSAGRSRPGAALTFKGNTETTSSTTFPRRQSSPTVVRGRITEPLGRGRMHANGKLSDHTIDSRRELSARKPVKISTESTGFGLTISKKSLDVAIRNMDIKNGANSTRPLTGSNLYPQSIRSTNQKSQPGHSTSAAASVNGTLPFGKHGAIAQNRNFINRSSESGNEDDKSSAKLSNFDIYESSRYDMILLKEDLKNSNWLHNVEDKSDQEPIFENGLEPLPEPFSPIEPM